jgi:hypothetical protein
MWRERLRVMKYTRNENAKKTRRLKTKSVNKRSA